MKSILVTCILVVSVCACSANKRGKSIANDENTVVVTGSWVHSHEEDKNNVKVFRPSSYKFPPSRGREKIVLKENNRLEYTPIAPNDFPETYIGSWKVKHGNILLEYDGKQKVYEIIESSISILELK